MAFESTPSALWADSLRRHKGLICSYVRVQTRCNTTLLDSVPFVGFHTAYENHFGAKLARARWQRCDTVSAFAVFYPGGPPSSYPALNAEGSLRGEVVPVNELCY